jgi:hypothetical protein
MHQGRPNPLPKSKLSFQCLLDAVNNSMGDLFFNNMAKLISKGQLKSGGQTHELVRKILRYGGLSVPVKAPLRRVIRLDKT